MNNVVKLKSLLVSACEASRMGHRDICTNLLEIAADIMPDIDPGVIETQFVVQATDNPTTFSEFEAASDEVVDTIETVENTIETPEDVEKAHIDFRDVIKNRWGNLYAGATN